MTAARHFMKPGALTDEQLKTDIKGDITTALGTARQLEAAGQNHTAQQMRTAVDEHLDELAAVNNGTWQPQFGGRDRD